SVMKMEVPRSGRTLTIVWFALVWFGPHFTPLVQSEKQSACDRTYPSDVQCGITVLRPSNGTSLPKHSAEAVRGEFPWHVAIFHQEYSSPVYACGGSLVSDRFVITAAHCVVNANNGYPLSKDKFFLQLGYHELGVAEEGCTQDLGVKKVHLHPQFRSGTHRHDLAMLEIEQPVRFNDRVLPICLDTGDQDPKSLFYRNIGKVPGWGYTEFDEISSWLHMTEVPIVTMTQCISHNPVGFAHTIHDGMFCGGYANGTNVCNGDSGGGLVTYRNKRWELQGIVSFTGLRDEMDKLVCDTHQYAGFVKVRYYKAWIGSILFGDNELAIHNEEAQNTSITTESSKLPTDCGKRLITTVPAIVNGVRSLAGQWPWHAAIFSVHQRSREYLCGGTLVSASCILTLASCVTDWHPRNRPFIVQLGQAQLFQSSITGREVRVLNVEKSDDSTMALLRLEVDVQYDNHIQPICLPSTADVVDSDFATSRVGTDGMVTGYGQTDPTGPLSHYLQATLMPIVDSKICVMRGIFDEGSALKMFCAGRGNGTNACKGDEGGGFYEVNQQGAWIITGVISGIKLYRKRCDPKGYVGLADVPFYIEWLLDRIGSIVAEPSDTINSPVTTEVSDKHKSEQQVYHEQQQNSGY
ncbi:transmembrane protease serine 9-like, partial [Anopheles ziemanni]|uniref:transmembrane protease serine 9-like n=1 Tax=Anopheles coustani TaxID=139045 RepID=UPI00265B12D2